MKNIVLIGMPGTGKSVVGRALAQRLDYTFVDVDDLIVEKTGKTLPEILRTQGLEAFLATEWTVTAQSNRVGVRLLGPEGSVELSRAREGELPSEGMVAGSVQVPPSGEPVIFLRDHAVTGGYPVIATVLEEDIDIAAQLPPGATVRFELA